MFHRIKKNHLYVHNTEPQTSQILLKYCDHMIQFTVLQLHVVNAIILPLHCSILLSIIIYTLKRIR